MALNTEQKRASALSALRPYVCLLPPLDLSIDQADRQQLAFLYSGILSTAPVITIGFSKLPSMMRRWRLLGVRQGQG
jgi:hypothetical protein